MQWFNLGTIIYEDDGDVDDDDDDDDGDGDDDDDDEFDCLQRRGWWAGPQLKLEVRHRRTLQN